MNTRLEHALQHARKRSESSPTTFAYIYIFKCENHKLYKIGVATNVEDRRQQCQIGCPFELRLIEYAKSTDPYALEERLHEMVGKHYVRGEWFRLTDDQLKPVIDVLQSIQQWK